ncbi:MAG TPA: cytochrome c biogenesis heme-transporting ATPase CcmA [Burkholderiales bacterium]
MLEADKLECERGSRTLFRQLSFSLAGGELLRVSGQNGSGKTSLLRILCGLLTPTQGEVRWKGTRIQDLAEDYSRELLYIGHAAAVKDDLTPAENLEIACRLAAVPFDRETLKSALQAYSVPELPVRKLSQGQRRRAALARLLLSASAPLWLLDEPFVALDPAASAFTEDLLSRHVGRGASVVYTTHQPAGIDSRARVVQL